MFRNTTQKKTNNTKYKKMQTDKYKKLDFVRQVFSILHDTGYRLVAGSISDFCPSDFCPCPLPSLSDDPPLPSRKPGRKVFGFASFESFASFVSFVSFVSFAS